MDLVFVHDKFLYGNEGEGAATRAMGRITSEHSEEEYFRVAPTWLPRRWLRMPLPPSPTSLIGAISPVLGSGVYVLAMIATGWLSMESRRRESPCCLRRLACQISDAEHLFQCRHLTTFRGGDLLTYILFSSSLSC